MFETFFWAQGKFGGRCPPVAPGLGNAPLV